MAYSKQNTERGYIKPGITRAEGKNYATQAKGFIEFAPKPSNEGHTSFARAEKRRAMFGR